MGTYIETVARVPSWSGTLAGCKSEPLFALRFRLKFPVVALASVATVRFSPPAPMSWGNAGERVTPAGTESADNVTVPLKPLRGVMEIASCDELPTTICRFDGWI